MTPGPAATIEKWSPDWCAERFTELCENSYQWLADLVNARRWLSRSLAIFLMLLGLVIVIKWTPPPVLPPGWDIMALDFAVRLFFRGMIGLGWFLMAGGFGLLFPRLDRAKIAITAFALLAMNLFLAAKGIDTFVFTSSVLGLAVSAGIPLLGFAVYIVKPTKTRLTVMIASVPIATAIGQWLTRIEVLQIGGYLTMSFRHFMVLWLFAAEYMARTNAFPLWSKTFWAYVASPAQIVSVFSIPSQYFKPTEDRWRSAIHGLSLIIQSAIYASIVMTFLGRIERNTLWLNDVTDFLRFGLENYFRYYWLSFFALSSVEGAFRILGFDVLAMYRAPLLAATPHERWQRWSSSVYEFLRLIVFVPLMRRWRSAFWAIMATFFVSFLIHEQPVAIRLFHPAHFEHCIRHAHFNFVYWMLHGLAVYLSLKTARHWPSGRTIKGWTSWAVTFFLMVVIHAFVP